MNKMNNRYDMLSFIQEEIKPLISAEIGVFKGEYSEQILHYMPQTDIVLVDVWKHQKESVYRDSSNLTDYKFKKVKEECRKRLKKFNTGQIFVQKDSVQASKLYADDTFDFIYIDGNHSYEATKADLEAWYPKLRRGGYFAGHDYDNYIGKQTTIQVKTAVLEFARANKAIVKSSGEKYPFSPSWYFKKGFKTLESFKDLKNPKGFLKGVGRNE